MGLGAGLDASGKSRLHPGFETPTVQSVTSRYTDCAIPAALKVILAGFGPLILEFVGRHVTSAPPTGPRSF